MARPITMLVIFFLCFNLFAGMLMATGAVGAIGLGSTSVGGDGATEDLRGETDSVPTGSGAGQTLFGLYNVLTSFVSGVFSYIFPGVAMLERAGVPGYITGMLNTVFSVLIAIDVVAFFRGWDL